MRNNKGFSLVELIVVIAIMAILAAVAIPTFAIFISRAQEASDVDFMNQVESAADLAFATETADKSVVVKVTATKEIESIVVTVGTTPYTFTKSGNTFNCDKIDAADVSQSLNTSLKDFRDVVDAGYTFKSVDAGTYKLNAKGDALETVSGN